MKTIIPLLMLLAFVACKKKGPPAPAPAPCAIDFTKIIGFRWVENVPGGGHVIELRSDGEWWDQSTKRGVYTTLGCDTVKLTSYSNGSPNYDSKFQVLSVTTNTLQIKNFILLAPPQAPKTYTNAGPIAPTPTVSTSKIPIDSSKFVNINWSRTGKGDWSDEPFLFSSNGDYFTHTQIWGVWKILNKDCVVVTAKNPTGIPYYDSFSFRVTRQVSDTLFMKWPKNEFTRWIKGQ